MKKTLLGVEKRMSRRKAMVGIVMTLVFFQMSGIVVNATTEDAQSSRQVSRLDRLRGVLVDFKSPQLVQNSGSLFTLTVNLTRSRQFFPICFVANVLLRLKDESGEVNTVVIGSSGTKRFPIDQQSMVLQIPCLTCNNLISDVTNLVSGQTSELIFSEGSIGIQIRKGIGLWLESFARSHLKPNMPQWSNEGAPQFISLLESGLSSSDILWRIQRTSWLLQMVSHARANNPLIVWEPTEVVPAFVSNSNIYFNASVDDKTDQNGHFKVNLTVYNKFDFPVNTGFLVDISSQSFINSLIPMLKGSELYNVGYWYCSLQGHETRSMMLNCSFPDKGFERKKYNVSIGCAPFIDVNDTNIYGAYFYDFRWLVSIKPYYDIGAEAQSLVRKMWYNVPIFYGTPSPSGQIFQTRTESIYYQGNEPFDTLIEHIDPSLLILILVLIGIPYTLFILLIVKNIRK